MRAYFSEVQLPILTAWQNTFAYYRSTLERYIQSLRRIDEDPNAIIQIEYLEEFNESATRMIHAFDSTDVGVGAFFREYSEFMIVTRRPDGSAITRALHQSRIEARMQAQEMGQMDYDYRNAMENVESMLKAITDAATSNRIGSAGQVMFQPGSFRGTPLYDKLTNIDDMVNSMAGRFFNQDGSLDHFKVGHTIYAGHDHGLSDLEVQVLMHIFNNPNTSLDDILQSYGMAYLILLTSQTDDNLNMLGILNEIDLRNHVEMLANAGDYAGSLMIDGDSKALQQLADAAATLLMEEAIAKITQGAPFVASDELNHLLTQA